MTLASLCQYSAQHVSDVNTSIFSSLRLLGALMCRLYFAVIIEVNVLIYLSSGKCYTYIMCRVLFWVILFLQACGVLWFLKFCVCYVLIMLKTPNLTTHKIFKYHGTTHACRNTLTQSHT